MRKNLSNRLYIATICGRWQEIADEYGVGIELDFYCQAKNMDGDRGAKVKAIVHKILQKYHVGVMHAPFNELFPAAIDPLARRLAMDRLNSAASLALEFGVKKMVVHSGYVPFTYFKAWQVDSSIRFWHEFMADKPHDFEIAIENVLDDEPSMLVEIAKGINLHNVGLCLDVGHANIAQRVNPDTGVGQDGWLDAMAPYLKHLHIHNNDGTGDFHKDLGEGTLDIERLLDGVIDKCSHETTITVETLAGKESFKWLSDRGYI